MNITQRQNILNWIDKIEQIDLNEQLNTHYPTEGDARKIAIGNYNAAEFIQLLKRVLSQLKTELNDGLGLILPHSHNFNNDFGAVNLETDLTNIFNWLSAGDLISASTRIESLIYYQVVNGFWEKPKKIIDKPKDEYNKLIRELAVVSDKLNSYIDRNKELVLSFNQSTENVNAFLANKKEEFTVLTANQQTSTTTLQEILNILAEAKIKEANIENIVVNQTKKP